MWPSHFYVFTQRTWAPTVEPILSEIINLWLFYCSCNLYWECILAVFPLNVLLHNHTYAMRTIQPQALLPCLIWPDTSPGMHLFFSLWILAVFSISALGWPVQGCPKRWTPGSVNMRWKGGVLLPAVGRRMQLFHLKFTDPRAHHIVHPSHKSIE